MHLALFPLSFNSLCVVRSYIGGYAQTHSFNVCIFHITYYCRHRRRRSFRCRWLAGQMMCARTAIGCRLSTDSVIQSVASWQSCECGNRVPVRILIACKVVQFYNGNHFICAKIIHKNKRKPHEAKHTRERQTKIGVCAFEITNGRA